MTSTYDPSTQVRNMGLFRSGQDFDYDDLEYLQDRELVTYFLVNELVFRAIGKGFKLKQKEEDHPKNDDIQEAIKPIYDDYVHGCTKNRLFGSMIFEMQAENERVYLNTFDPRDFTVEFDMFDNFTKLEVTEKIEFYDNEKVLEARPIDKNKFINFLYTYRKGKRERNKGTSYIESTYDILVGIQNLSESCVYFVIRVGAGLKIIWVPMDKLQDDDYMAELEENIQEMNAENTTMILGMDAEGNKTEVQLLATQPIAFSELLDFYYRLLSLRTGIPVTILQGITPGQLEGGKINESLLFDVLQAIQKICEIILRWIIDWIAGSKTIDLGDYEIEWVTREIIDEAGIQKLLSTKLANLKELLALSIDFDKAAKMSGLELTTEDIDEEAVEEKRQMSESLMNKDSTEDTDGKPTDTTKGDSEEEESED